MDNYKFDPPGNRMSSLPLAIHCGLAPQLDTGSGVAATQSSAFHSKMSGEEGWEEKWARLTREQRDECESWEIPQEFEVLGKTLPYEEA